EAFRNCTSLTSVTIGKGVTSIGKNAFYGCTGELIVNCNIPSATDTNGGAFYGADFTKVTIGNSVTEIGSYAFEDCTSLTSVDITDLVAWCKIKFGNYLSNPLCYAYNLYLNGALVEDLVIPDSVTAIGERTFCQCTSLTSVTIPDSVTTIEDSAFIDCTSLTNVTIGMGVTSIGWSAFRGCNSLTSITIPDGVTTIEYWAFAFCSNLKNIYCKPVVPPLGSNSMFQNNASDRNIYVPIESVEAYKSAEYWSEYSDMIKGYNFETGEVIPETPLRPANNEIWYTNDSTTEPTALYKTDVFDVNVISNTYDVDKKCWVIKFDGEVTKIGSHAFQECSCITSVTIPNSVTKIGAYAFNGCTNLVSIIIPDGVTSIEENAFAMCRNLTNITIPQGVSEIKRWSFYGCTNLIGVTIPDSVIYIGQCAFAYCSNLQSVSIPIGITTIESDAFSFCSTLTSITIPSTVEYIGDSAFRGCSNLTAFYGKFASDDNRCLVLNGVLNSFAPSGLELYDIPSNVTTIGTSSFQYCESLNSVTIPNSVKVIEAWAFQCCNGLKNINIPNGTTTIGNYAFSYCNSLTSVTIPNSVNSIGYSAFDGCANLKIVWSKNLTPPTAIFSEDNIWNAFEGCHADLAISVPSQSYDAFKTAPGWSDYKSSIVDDGYILEDDYFEDLEDF
ncbi:MAG: leucine-rich repeat domain-containing protein, partial [Alistipes sp.]|nr:leucine-rich repeat domain-containing protein [Alistipes sp.]